MKESLTALNHHPRILTYRCISNMSHVVLSTPGCATPTHCQGPQLSRDLVCSDSDLNCVVRLAKRLQCKASCIPWTLTFRVMCKVATVLNQSLCHLQDRHFNGTSFVPSETLKSQKSPYPPSPGAGSNTGAELVTTAGCLALVSEDLCSPG